MAIPFLSDIQLGDYTIGINSNDKKLELNNYYKGQYCTLKENVLYIDEDYKPIISTKTTCKYFSSQVYNEEIADGRRITGFGGTFTLSNVKTTDKYFYKKHLEPFWGAKINNEGNIKGEEDWEFLIAIINEKFYTFMNIDTGYLINNQLEKIKINNPKDYYYINYETLKEFTTGSDITNNKNKKKIENDTIKNTLIDINNTATDTILSTNNNLNINTNKILNIKSNNINLDNKALKLTTNHGIQIGIGSPSLELGDLDHLVIGYDNLPHLSTGVTEESKQGSLFTVGNGTGKDNLHNCFTITNGGGINIDTEESVNINSKRLIWNNNNVIAGKFIHLVKFIIEQHTIKDKNWGDRIKYIYLTAFLYIQNDNIEPIRSYADLGLNKEIPGFIWDNNQEITIPYIQTYSGSNPDPAPGAQKMAYGIWYPTLTMRNQEIKHQLIDINDLKIEDLTYPA